MGHGCLAFDERNYADVLRRDAEDFIHVRIAVGHFVQETAAGPKLDGALARVGVWLVARDPNGNTARQGEAASPPDAYRVSSNRFLERVPTKNADLRRRRC